MDILNLIIGFTILLLYFLIVPLIIGVGGCRLLYRKRCVSTVEAYLWGNVILLALYELLYIPVTFLLLPFHVLCIIFGVCIVLMMGLTLATCKKELLSRLKKLLQHTKHLPFPAYVLFLLILIQICFYLFGANISGSAGDDDGYVVMSLNTITDDGIMVQNETDGSVQNPADRLKYSLSSWVHYISFLGKISGIHTTIIAHTFLPIILVPMAYMVYYILGYLFFHGNERKIFCFLIWMYIIMSFGAYSTYTVTFRLNITIWQGKGVMAAILLPFTLHFILTTKHWRWRELIKLGLLISATVSLSLMGLGFPLLIVIGGFIAQFQKRSMRNIIIILPILLLCSVGAYMFAVKWYGESFFTIEYLKNTFPIASNNLILAYRNYWNGSWIQCLFYVSIIFLLISYKRKHSSKILLRYLLIISVIIFNPLFYTLSYTIFPLWNTYIRMFYMLFPEIIMGYVITSLMSLLPSESVRYVGSIVMFLYIVITGTSFQSVAHFQPAENLYKIPPETIEICQILKEDCDGSPFVLTPTDMNVFLRQYDDNIRLFWSRWHFSYRLAQVSDIPQEYYDLMTDHNLYLILGVNAGERASIEALGAQLLTTVGDYVIYKSPH